jgi:hypothetical protein
MSENDDLFLALQGLRSALDASAIPAKLLQQLKAKLREFEALAKNKKPKRKVGAKVKEDVPMDYMTIALQYLNQPTVGEKSVESLINIAIGFGGFGGTKNAKLMTGIASRARRLIARVETSRASSTGEIQGADDDGIRDDDVAYGIKSAEPAPSN